MSMSVSPEAMVMHAFQQQQANVHLQAQIGLVKKSRDAEASAVAQLIDSVPPPEGAKGQHINLKV